MVQVPGPGYLGRVRRRPFFVAHVHDGSVLHGLWGSVALLLLGSVFGPVERNKVRHTFRTIASCITPLIGLGADTVAFFTSSMFWVRPATAATTHPILSSSAKNVRSSSLRPALRERKTRLRAPCSTIHVAIDRPSPPRPPARRYDPLGFRANVLVDRTLVIVELSCGMFKITLPM